MSVHELFWRAKSTVAIAPAMTVIKPPSSLILNGSIDIVLSFCFTVVHKIGTPLTLLQRAPQDIADRSYLHSPPGHVVQISRLSIDARDAQSRGGIAVLVPVEPKDHAMLNFRSDQHTCKLEQSSVSPQPLASICSASPPTITWPTTSNCSLHYH